MRWIVVMALLVAAVFTHLSACAWSLGGPITPEGRLVRLWTWTAEEGERELAIRVRGEPDGAGETWESLERRAFTTGLVLPAVLLIGALLLTLGGRRHRKHRPAARDPGLLLAIGERRRKRRGTGSGGR